MTSTLPRIVKEIMSSPVVTVRPGSTMGEALALMREKNIGAVVVINDEEYPIGILTETDILRAIAEHKHLLELPVSQIMSKPVIFCTPETSILKAFVTMYENNIRRLPVVKNGRLIGIVTERDLIVWVLKLLGYPVNFTIHST